MQMLRPAKNRLTPTQTNQVDLGNTYANKFC